jgi:spermidine synthase
MVFPAAVLLSAAAALATEIAIVRLGAPYVGQSLVPWSAAITSVLIGLMVGHVIGGSIGGAQASPVRLRTALGAAWLCGGAAALLMPPSVAWLAAHGGFGEDDFWRAPAAVAALAWPPSVAAGAVSPLVIRLWSLQAPGERPRVIAHCYAAGAAGSIIGTAMAGFVLLDRLGSAGLVAAIAGTWLVLAAIAMPWRWPARAAIVAAGAAAVVPISSMTPCLIESRYTCIRLFDRALADGGIARFMLLDEGVHSASDRDHPQKLHLGYAVLVDQLAAAAFATNATPRAIVIGGGGNTLSRAWASRVPPVAVTSIEIDAKVAAAAAERMWAEPSPTLVTRIGDGRVLLQTIARPSADVVLMDAYRSRGVPPHLVTDEFNRLVLERLSHNGLFLSNVIDRVLGPQLAASVALTLKQSFPAVDLWVPEGAGARGLTNIVVAAWRNPTIAIRPATLTVDSTIVPAGEAASSIRSNWRRIDIHDLERAFPKLCPMQLSDDLAPVERLLAGGVRCSNTPTHARN